MHKVKIETLFSETLEANETQSFRYKITYENAFLKGFLQTNNTQLSISLVNQANLEIEGFDRLLTDALELPPSQRILYWEQHLIKGMYICGTLKNVSAYPNKVNLYLYLEKNEK